MTNEQQQAELPPLPEPKWLECDTPGADFDTTFVATWLEAKDMLDVDEGAGWQEQAKPLFTAGQMRAYALAALSQPQQAEPVAFGITYRGAFTALHLLEANAQHHLRGLLANDTEDGAHREIVPLYTAPQQAAAVPAGFKLVPVEPTEAMLREADRIIGPDPRFMRMTWTAMLAAAPSAPAAAQAATADGATALQAESAECRCVNVGACDGSCAPYIGNDARTIDRMDRDMTQLIEERVERQRFIDALLDALLGSGRADWSSAYHFKEALDDALERIADLKATHPSPADADKLDAGRLAEQTTWQPIDSAPQSGEIMLWWRNAGACVGYFAVDDNWKRGSKTPESGWKGEADEVIPKNQKDCTHWRLLPDAPPGHKYPAFEGQSSAHDSLKKAIAFRRVAAVAASKQGGAHG